MSEDVVIKEVAPQWIVSVREVIANYPAIGMLYPKIFTQIGSTPPDLGIPIAIWHDMMQKEQDVDGEAGFLLKQPLASHGTAKMYQLPAMKAASYMHRGAFNRFPEAYDKVTDWVKDNQYRIAGPFRELYHQLSQPVRQDDESNVTEIQIPVEKIA
jgi:effector-binding domain-containing protein